MKMKLRSILAAMTSRHSKKGFTIVEMTLVLAIILGLAGLLFLGLTAYKNGSDKTQCVLQLATVQKSVRSAENLDTLAPETVLTATGATGNADLVTEGYLSATVPLSCPRDGTPYTYLGTVPDTGVAYATCVTYGSLAGNLAHAPTASQLANW